MKTPFVMNRADRDRLFDDLQRIAAASGGIVSKTLFEATCDFAEAGDPAAQETLRRCYVVAVRARLKTKGEGTC
jgi:hypothetical protein